MEMKEMTLEALEERKAAIGAECEVDGADTDALLEEVRSINAEIESRQKAEAEKAEIRKAVAEGTAKTTVVESVMEEKEERNMEFTVDSKEYRSLWLRNLQGNLTTEERSGFAQTGDYATNAIPTLVADQFFEKMKKLAPMLSEITLMRVAGNLQFVTEGVRNAASKHTENAAISTSDDTTIKVVLGAIEFAKIVGISKSAKMMSIDAFEGWLVEMLAGDIARAIDNYILNDATNGVAACLYTTGTNQILNTASYTYKNICDLVALLPAAYDAEAKIITNKKTLYGQIAQITTSSGQPIFVQDTEGGMVGRLLGYPVVVDDYVTTANNAVYLGAWKKVVGNLSEGPQVEASDIAGFANAQILYRGYASFDSKVALPEGIVRLVSTTA